MSVVLGLYTFGPYGAIWGPLLSASLLALLDFYKKELGTVGIKATLITDATSPAPSPAPIVRTVPMLTSTPGSNMLSPGSASLEISMVNLTETSQQPRTPATPAPPAALS